MTDSKSIPVELSPVFEGERVRKGDMQVELGGPSMEHKCELVQARELDEIEDGKIQVIGPDLDTMKEGQKYPIAILMEVAGVQVEKDLEAVIERRVHDFANYIEGLMHLNQRYDIWLRLSKKSYKKGFNTLKYLGLALYKLFKAELPFIEKIQFTIYTDPVKVKEVHDSAIKIYETRDAKARNLKDENVDTFYSCALCQSFAPQHVCIITPNRISLCGAINWFDARAAAKVDPKGPLQVVPKGECLDEVKGEYTGANEFIEKKSLGATKKFYLYSAFGFPHTSCGCFETIAFYIPEVDGFGFVDRGFKEPTVNGLPFATLATQVGGGIQTEGFVGIGIEYFRSPKFFQADRGWNRVAWISSTLRKRIDDAIPEELKDKIPSEKEAAHINDLQKFLVEKDHPLAEAIKEKQASLTGEAEAQVAETPTAQAVPVNPSEVSGFPTGTSAGGGVSVTLKGAKIKIGKIILKR